MVCFCTTPSATKYLRREPAKSVVPLSSINIDVPSARPEWPASRASSDRVPVEVVSLPSRGEGRVPGGGWVCLGIPGADGGFGFGAVSGLSIRPPGPA